MIVEGQDCWSVERGGKGETVALRGEGTVGRSKTYRACDTPNMVGS